MGNAQHRANLAEQKKSIVNNVNEVIDKWSIKNTKCIVIGKHFGKIHDIDCILVNEDDSNKILIASISQDSKLLIWLLQIMKTKKGKIKKIKVEKVGGINVRHSWCLNCSFSKNGEFIAFGGLDNKITIYEKQNNEYRYNPYLTVNSVKSNSKCYISCIKFVNLENNYFIIYASGDGNIYLLNINGQNKTPQSIANTHKLTESLGLDICFFHNKYYIAYSSGNYGVYIMDITQILYKTYNNNDDIEQIQHTQILNDFGDDAHFVSFSPNGEFIAITYNDTIYRVYCRNCNNMTYYLLCTVTLSSSSRNVCRIKCIQWIDDYTLIVADDGNNSLNITYLQSIKVNTNYKSALIHAIQYIFKLITNESISSLASNICDIILLFVAIYQPQHFAMCYIDDDDDYIGHQSLITCPHANDKKSIIITAANSRQLNAIITH